MYIGSNAYGAAAWPRPAIIVIVLVVVVVILIIIIVVVVVEIIIILVVVVRPASAGYGLRRLGGRLPTKA
jgi:hypothetical protein